MKNVVKHQALFINSLPLNKDLPMVMHIDLNSCFAIIEQQANRLLRGKPVGVSAYDTPRGFVLAASYEAKAMGIKLGVNVEQARVMAPGIVIMTPDPAKYREAHRLFKKVMLEYTPDVVAKSIDEFVLNLEHSPILRRKILDLRCEQVASSSSKISNLESNISASLHNEAMKQIGEEMKKRIAESLGEWVTVNIGIGTNRFLAKYAAGFAKPNGMTLIDHVNLREMYTGMKLVDLPGINVRFRARLRAVGIFTPLDFLNSDLDTLRKQVFKSINGYHWYMRLRGYETDAVEFSTKSIGHQYALPDKTSDIEKLEKLIMKLAEKTGRRLRKNNYYATGVHLYLGFINEFAGHEDPASFEHMSKISSWHHGEKVGHRLYSTIDIYESLKRLLGKAEIPRAVRILAVNVYGLQPWDPEQLSLFDSGRELNPSKQLRISEHKFRKLDARKRISDSVDTINNRYGEFIITPAVMLEMQDTILDRIAFGQVRDI